MIKLEVMDYNHRQLLADVKVTKAGPNKYYIEGAEEKESVLTKRQLYYVLHHLIGTEVEEVAFMLLDMKENPKATVGFFGINGTYLFSK
jgi:hypothetical protein